MSRRRAASDSGRRFTLEEDTPKRIPIHWELGIARQLEEMLSANPPICRPSKSPWSSDSLSLEEGWHATIRRGLSPPKRNDKT